MTFDEFRKTAAQKGQDKEDAMREAWVAATLAEREACAAIADKYTCGTCGMDGKAGREIRMRSNV